MKLPAIVSAVLLLSVLACHNTKKPDNPSGLSATNHAATGHATQKGDKEILMDALVKLPDNAILYWQWPAESRKAFAAEYLRSGKPPVQKEFSGVEAATNRTLSLRVVDGIFQVILYPAGAGRNVLLVRNSAGGDEDIKFYSYIHGTVAPADSMLLRRTVYTMLASDSPKGKAKADSMLREADMDFGNPDAIRIDLKPFEADKRLFKNSAFTVRFNPATATFTAQ